MENSATSQYALVRQGDLFAVQYSGPEPDIQFPTNMEGD